MRCIQWQLDLIEDDRRVCVSVFLLAWASEKNVCVGVSVTVSWALPQGCRLEKHALTVPRFLCVCLLNISFVFLWNHVIVLVHYGFFIGPIGLESSL